ncbi:hypothetical protein AX16_010844 [Volvariella volvacea WC 439]|nr:hypothetical protein AX16_010844 [Volvariella volvacea WC 439]
MDIRPTDKMRSDYSEKRYQKGNREQLSLQLWLTWYPAGGQLQGLIVIDAMHAGNIRAEPLRCDLNTHEAIILDSSTWVENRGRDRADGQYIYPVTLFRYIDNDDANPEERLEECIREMPEALSPLDKLYLQILRSSHKPDNTQLQDLLFIICTPLFWENNPSMGGPKFNRGPSITNDGWSVEQLKRVTNLALFLFQNEVACRFNLKKLHSVLRIPPYGSDSGCQLHHKSFTDSLHNYQRSGHYHLDSEKNGTRIIARSFFVVGGCIADCFIIFQMILHQTS